MLILPSSRLWSFIDWGSKLRCVRLLLNWSLTCTLKLAVHVLGTESLFPVTTNKKWTNLEQYYKRWRWSAAESLVVANMKLVRGPLEEAHKTKWILLKATIPAFEPAYDTCWLQEPWSCWRGLDADEIDMWSKWNRCENGRFTSASPYTAMVVLGFSLSLSLSLLHIDVNYTTIILCTI